MLPPINPMMAYRMRARSAEFPSAVLWNAIFNCRAMDLRVSQIAETPKQNHAPNDCASRNGNPGRCPMPAIVPQTRVSLWNR